MNERYPMVKNLKLRSHRDPSSLGLTIEWVTKTAVWDAFNLELQNWAVKNEKKPTLFLAFISSGYSGIDAIVIVLF